MGVILGADCAECGYHTKLFLGCGLRDDQAETVLSAFSAADKEAFQSLKPVHFSVQRMLGRCEDCAELFSAPVADVTDSCQDAYRIGGYCPKCDRYAMLYESWEWQEAPVQCPQCGATLKLLRQGRWD